MVIERYCHVVPKDSGSITVLWKASHILCLVTTSICSFIAVMNLIAVMESFGHRCFCYANLSFEEVHPYETVGAIPKHLSFHNAKTIWGKEAYCLYPKVTYEFSMVIAIIMLAFFAILPKGGQAEDRSVYTETWKMIPWAVIFGIIMTVAMATNYILLKRGIQVFVEQIYEKLREKGLCNVDCHDALNIVSLIFNRDEVYLSRYLTILRVTTFISLLAWSLLLASLVLRMLIGADFRIIIYNLKPGKAMLDDGSSVSSASFQDDDERIKSKMLLTIRSQSQQEVDSKDDDDDTPDDVSETEM